MNKRLAIGAAGTLVAVGAGVGIGVAVTGTSVAAPAAPTSSSSTPSGSHSSSHTAGAGKKRHDAIDRLKDLEHAQWVTSDKGKNVSHEAIHGTVTAVSPTSLSVKAADGTTYSYTVGSGTKVHLRQSGKGSAKTGAISNVKTGDHVIASGTLSGSTATAEQVLDTGTK